MKRIAIILLLCVIGCNLHIPIADDVQHRPSVGSYWMYEVGLHWTEDTAIHAGDFQFNKYGFPFKIYSLTELDLILDDWEGWNIPYDRQLRNCRWFANALRSYAQVFLPGIALGVVHYDYEFALYGHAAAIFVECDTSSGPGWYTNADNYTTWIVNFRHSADLTHIIGIKYESFNVDKWKLRFIDL